MRKAATVVLPVPGLPVNVMCKVGAPRATKDAISAPRDRKSSSPRRAGSMRPAARRRLKPVKALRLEDMRLPVAYDQAGGAGGPRYRVHPAVELADKRLIALNVVGLPVMRTWFLVNLVQKRLLPSAAAVRQFMIDQGHTYLPRFAAIGEPGAEVRASRAAKRRRRRVPIQPPGSEHLP
jgi:hypothetical protein